ncbi:hypothetical protein QJS66_17080 [Kocuria rhizophila]|nr:hypothetical protein QJS66_17080 [Kocuria rhizophila]
MAAAGRRVRGGGGVPAGAAQTRPYFDAARFASATGAPGPAEIGCAIAAPRVIRDFAAEAGADYDVLLIRSNYRFTEDFACRGASLPVPGARRRGAR